jgi:hypothetical protein
VWRELTRATLRTFAYGKKIKGVGGYGLDIFFRQVMAKEGLEEELVRMLILDVQKVKTLPG